MTNETETAFSLKDFLLSFGEILGVLGAGILVGAIGVIRKKKWNLFKQEKKERRFVENHGQLHEMLTELRVTIRACRCLIFQFHNGGSFADGTSIKRFSVTHESCGSSVPSMILESQDVLLTRYMELIRIMDTQSGKIIKTDSLPPCAFRSGLEINNAEYFSVVPLKCMDGITPLGFLCCHWCSSESLDEIESEGVTQENLEELILQNGATINTIMSYKPRKN